MVYSVIIFYDEHVFLPLPNAAIISETVWHKFASLHNIPATHN